MPHLQQTILSAASGYFGAAARYWAAKQRGEDMEAPTQELVGRSIFYRHALESYLAQPHAHHEFAERRLRYLRRHVEFIAERYATEKRLFALLEGMRLGVDQVAEERQKYLDLFRYAPEPALLTDRAGMIHDANLAAGEAFGMRRSRMLGAYIAASDRQTFRIHLRRGDREWESELGDGSRARFSVRENSAGELHWLVHACTD